MPNFQETVLWPENLVLDVRKAHEDVMVVFVHFSDLQFLKAARSEIPMSLVSQWSANVR